MEALDLRDEPTTTLDIEPAELMKLGAVDSELYGQIFFPNTFRQKPPAFARELWNILEHPDVRLANVLIFRGGSKTTRLRVFASKRIAYGISRTILIIGSAEDDAKRSLGWIKRQIERNTLWTSTFGLARGSKWEETLIEIKHEALGHSVWITAAGINSSLRGINFDDYRPDLIILDDPQTDEAASSEEQRRKTRSLIMTSVRNSLAPIVDEPNAKMVMLATPIAKGDVTQTALRDPAWHSLQIPCWTYDTLNLPVDKQESVWPERFPSRDLRKEKLDAVAVNELSGFTREKEVRITSQETALFLPSWIKVHREKTPDDFRGSFCVLAIDPVPPPSDREIEKGLRDKDYECQYVWARDNSGYHLLECAKSRGHDPSWSVATALGLAAKWRVAHIVVEVVAYQRVLEWHLKQEMARRRVHHAVVPFKSLYKSKFARIVGVLKPLATSGLLHIWPQHSEFMDQWTSYPDVDHDDDLDASTIALQDIANPHLERAANDDDPYLDDSAIERFPFTRACP